uniref:Reverse transcriptase Ty1/copia-type domain-containing protein n=1 Tax=Physcomitrium patens TaxID=3218 RepID=A0A2K1IJ19_PHYPA|nr:hypothetical protein PHYPA_027967 [Physcomitrium patens]
MANYSMCELRTRRWAYPTTIEVRTVGFSKPPQRGCHHANDTLLAAKHVLRNCWERGSSKHQMVASSCIACKGQWAKHRSLHALSSPGIQAVATASNGNQCAKPPLLPLACKSTTKHFDIKYHMIREQIKINVLQFDYISTNDNVADIFMKPFAPEKFKKLCALHIVQPG